MRAAAKDLPGIRLFVSDALAPGVDVVLASHQAHYLLRVMRLKSGDRVRLFNGRDGEWLGCLATGSRSSITILLERQTRLQEAKDGPWLVFAPVKKTATDFIVEKAAELGAARLLPVLTERTIAQRVNVQRLLATATEAVEQCGRLSVPEVATPVTLPALAAAWPTQRPLLIAHPRAQGDPLPLVDALIELVQRRACFVEAMPLAFLIGPEGGLTDAELDVLAGLPCARIVHLGAYTLRAETAAAAVLACWQAVVEARRGNASKP